MKKLLISFVVLIFLTGTAHAHGNISKLPNTVQILQYKMKLHMNADDMDSRNNLAMAYFRTNKFEEAKTQLEYVLEKDWSNFDALDGMGIVLVKMGQNQEALLYLNKAVAINPQDVMVHVHLAVTYKNLNMVELADEEMAKARSQVGGPEELKDIDREIEILSGS